VESGTSWRTLFQLRQRLAQFVRFEAEGAGLALVGDAPASIDQINAVRPTGVRLLGCVREFIQNGRELDSELAHARARYVGTLVFTLRTDEDHVVFYIALHLPHVAGMRLDDVDREKSNPTTVLLIQLVEGGNLPPKGRSGIAPEHQHHRMVRIQVR